MFVKFINETSVEPAPIVVQDSENTYANPTPETLLKFGYKHLVETECPNAEGCTYSVKYVDDGEQITKTWVAHEITVENEEGDDESAE